MDSITAPHISVPEQARVVGEVHDCVIGEL